MSTQRDQTLALMGKRLVVKLAARGIVETEILEVSPSGNFVKLKGEGWVEQVHVEKHEVLSPLPSPKVPRAERAPEEAMR